VAVHGFFTGLVVSIIASRAANGWPAPEGIAEQLCYSPGE